MSKVIKMLSVLLLISSICFSQDDTSGPTKVNFIIKGGMGTSWIISPKVFLTDPADPTTNAQILPATNSFTGFLGLQSVIPLNNYWLFVPEVDFNYISGEIRVDQLKTLESSQRLQAYGRIELLLNFAVISSDNFWISFGPGIFFTVADNKGFDEAVRDINDTVVIDSDNPVGLRFRLAAYIFLGTRTYLDIKFDSDLYRNFEFKDDVYHMTMSMQSITFGLGWRTTKDR
jgi:hypothetical protein